MQMIEDVQVTVFLLFYDYPYEWQECKCHLPTLLLLLQFCV